MEFTQEQAYEMGRLHFTEGKHLNPFDFFASEELWREWIKGYTSQRDILDWFSGDNNEAQS